MRVRLATPAGRGIIDRGKWREGTRSSDVVGSRYVLHERYRLMQNLYTGYRSCIQIIYDLITITSEINFDPGSVQVIRL